MFLSAADLVKKSFAIYRDNAKLFLQYVALIYLPTVFISLVINTLALIGEGKQGLILFFALGGLGLFIAWVVSLWITLAFIRVIAKRAAGQVHGTVSEETQAAKALIVPAILASILGIIITFAGFLFFFIPGIIFFIWFAFFLYAIALDQKKIIDSFRQSRQLVRGHWWSVAWKFFVLGCIYILGLFIVQWVFVRPIDSFLSPIGSATLTSILLNLLASLIIFAYGALFFPFVTAAQTLLYLDLKQLATTAPPSPLNQPLEPPMHP